MRKIYHSIVRLIGGKYIAELERQWALAVWEAIRAEEEMDRCNYEPRR